MITIIKKIFRKVRKKLHYLLLANPQQIVFTDYINKYYDNNKRFYFIQVGANDGISHDNLYFFVKNNKNIKGIVIEPIKDYFDELKKNYAFATNILPLNLAIHNYLKKVDLYRLDKQKEIFSPDWARGIASVHPKHHLKSNTPTDFIIKETVNADTFMNVYYQYTKMNEKIDLIQIDVESYDWEVLKMIDLKELMPAIIKYEWINLNYLEQVMSIYYLKSNKYKIYIENNDIIAIL